MRDLRITSEQTTYDINPDGCLASDISQLTEARRRSDVLSGLWQTVIDTQGAIGR